MKANPIYKCRSCGKTIVKRQVMVAADEMSCLPQIDTHICDVEMVGDERLDQDVFMEEYVGIIELVGYVTKREN